MSILNKINYIKLITLFLAFILIADFCFAQCTVSKGKLNDNILNYRHRKEEIYKNDDLHNGIQSAYIQLGILQSIAAKNLMQFVLYVDVSAYGSYRMVVPRKIIIEFSDNSKLDLLAEQLLAPSTVASIFVEHSIFRIHLDTFLQLQSKSITRITIIDTRLNLELVCLPYLDILKEQANCLVHSLEQ